MQQSDTRKNTVGGTRLLRKGEGNSGAPQPVHSDARRPEPITVVHLEPAAVLNPRGRGGGGAHTVQGNETVDALPSFAVPHLHSPTPSRHGPVGNKTHSLTPPLRAWQGAPCARPRRGLLTARWRLEMPQLRGIAGGGGVAVPQTHLLMGTHRHNTRPRS